MLTVVYRLGERLGRLSAKAGLRLGETFRWKKAARPAPAVVEPPPSPAVPSNNVVHLTLKRNHVPLLVGLLGLNIVLLVTLAVLAARPARAPEVVVATPLPPTLTPLSIQSINTEVAKVLPELQITVSPAPVGATPTAPPNPLVLGGTVFYAYRQAGRTNLWAQVLGRPQPQRLTAGTWDDTDPAVSPDGTRLAFASRRDGSWNLYALNLATGEVKQLTTGLDYKGHPAWSPDSRWLVFEIYRNNNLDIAIVSAEGGDVTPLTADPAADYEPTWSPANNGRELIWVSTRSGKPELWAFSLDHPQEAMLRKLTDSPDVYPENPRYSPNGQEVIYDDAASPLSLVYAHSATDPGGKSTEVGQGQHPVWSPDGSSLLTVAPQEDGQDYLLMAPLGQYGLGQIAYKATSGHFGDIDWSRIALPEALPGTMGQAAQVVDASLWTEPVTASVAADPPYTFAPLPSVTAPDGRLSERVIDAFAGLRRTVAQAAGWDFLGTLDNALVLLDAPPPPSTDPASWLKAGRAFDFSRVTADAGWVDITREDYGFLTYWHVWVRTVRQDGSQGAPLHRLPWNFSARYSGRPKPYDAGGEYYSVMPAGYFVDFTALAEDFGWTRIAAQKNWPYFFPGILYWRFEHHDGLDWTTALREVYTARQAATQTPVPSPTTTPTITLTPSETGTPTETYTPTPKPTWTPAPTRTRWPTWTMSPTRTPWPTWTLTLTRTPWPTWTVSPTITPRPTWTLTSTPTIRPTRTPSPTITPSPTRTPTPTITPSPTRTPSLTPTDTPVPTDTLIPTDTLAPSDTPPGFNADGLPYGGVPWTIPGLVEAENFNTGGEGVAYHSLSDRNLGNAHIRYGASGEETVSISSLSPAPGYRLSQVKAGEWLKYTVNVLYDGFYNLTASVSCGDPACGSFHVEFDGQSTSPIYVPPTGGWNVMTNVSARVYLKAGTHVLRTVMDSNGPAGDNGYVGGVDYLTFVYSP
jgi:TolB protein